jgi:hypothetical protein
MFALDSFCYLIVETLVVDSSTFMCMALHDNIKVKLKFLFGP